MTGSLSCDEVLWPHLFDPHVVEPAVSFLADLAGDGRALELGIGTGRLALPLHRRGIRVDGIELSAAMVEQLHAHPGSADIDVTIGDFSTTKVHGLFTLAYLVRNTIMNLTTQDAEVDCFLNVASHLEPGGCFVIEVVVPPWQRLPPGETVMAFDVSPETSRLRRDRRGDAALVVAPLLVRGGRDEDLLGAVQVRLAIRVGSHGPPGRDGLARPVERLARRALHQHQPQPYLGVAETRVARDRAARERRPARCSLAKQDPAIAGRGLRGRSVRAVDVGAVVDPQDRHPVAVFVDLVDHPIRATAS